MPQHHLTAPRGRDLAPRSVLLEGRFGRMFRTLPPFEPDDAELDRLAQLMLEGNQLPGGWQPGEPQDLDNASIPAGFTYLGQFVDHDITFDPASSLERQNDPDALENFRTPRYDLDSLYGRGVNNDPFLYDQASRAKLLIGANENGEPDLPRNAQGRALIGDPRNDENILVSQLHLLFLRFHNAVVDHVQSETGLEGEDLFLEAQRVVRWHYQWIVVHDFVRRVVGDDVLDDILTSEPYLTTGPQPEIRRRTVRLRFYRWQRQPFMPVEFSVAAYRFGHSMIRPNYFFANPPVPERPIFTADPNAGELDDLRGFRPLPRLWTVQWDFLFEVGDGTRLQSSRKIDARLAPPLQTLPGLTPAALALRNLRRGKALRLPSGQHVARAMCIEPMTADELELGDLASAFGGHSPLWFYILQEAGRLMNGERLGPVGARIVAEVLLGLLKGDHLSYISVLPCWTPELPRADDSTFTMADLINFVDSSAPTPAGESPSPIAQPEVAAG
jgi:hypothetical protein